MKVKSLIALLLSGGLILESCSGVVVTDRYFTKGTHPVSTKFLPPRVEEEETETTTNFSPEKIEVISVMPPLPAGQTEYKKLKLTPRHTVEEVQKISREQKLEIISLNDNLVIETQGSSGRWYTGWIEPKTILLAKKTADSEQFREYEIVRLGVCSNAVRGLKIRITPALVEESSQKLITQQVIERYLDKKTVVQTRQKSSWWPWIMSTVIVAGSIAYWSEKERKDSKL